MQARVIGLWGSWWHAGQQLAAESYLTWGVGLLNRHAAEAMSLRMAQLSVATAAQGAAVRLVVLSQRPHKVTPDVLAAPVHFPASFLRARH